ncbi:MAG: small, acid-soluble spore protein, alpha/beta type [Clostridia bacterium]|nr:small, acid-soluble spore protein, alpha/beta type [Clostridia bacterium]MDD4049089.1 small, acid-soluble spore protein, alpha/beta type [Clostridia bacterium]
MARKKKEPTAKDLLKIEIAKELGLWQKIEELGWPELTAEESGRIGGIMTHRIREGKKNEKQH